MNGIYVKIDCDIQTKPSFQDIIDAIEIDCEGMTFPSNFSALGGLVSLWIYFQSHATDGVLEMSIPKLCRRVGGSPEFWSAVEDAGWLEVLDGQIRLPQWKDKFWDGSQAKTTSDRQANSRRQQRLREKKRAEETKGECKLLAIGNTNSEKFTSDDAPESSNDNVARDNTDTSRATNNDVTKCRAPRIEQNILKENNNRIEQTGAVSKKQDDLLYLSDCHKFLSLLKSAGVVAPEQTPGWLEEKLKQSKDVFLKAASQLKYTSLMQGDSPCTVFNFKNESWVQRLADGEFNTKKVEVERTFFPPAAQQMTPEEAKEWVAASEENRKYYDSWVLSEKKKRKAMGIGR